MSGITTRSWKGRVFTVLTRDGLAEDFVLDLAQRSFPPELVTSEQMWAFVNIGGLRMRYSEELIEAMIRLREVTLTGSSRVV